MTSLTTALYSAKNGLSTTQSLSAITADNVANATTPGYARRTAVLVSGGPDQGGAILKEIRREVDSSLVRMSRLENSKMAHQEAIHEGLRGYTIYLGQPGDGISPAEKFSAFQNAMTTLANSPASNGAQSGAVLAAEDLAASIRGASNTLANTKSEVHMEIRYEVADLNQALYDLASLNQTRRDFSSGSLEAAQFEDKIEGLLDQISGIIDIRTTRSNDGTLSVYTSAGTALLEGKRVNDVTYNQGTGTLLAGEQDITPNRDGVRGLREGSLAGLIALNQEILPQFQLQLDEYARSLIEAFEDADASLTAGQAGLFTDNGSAYDPANLSGLAGRLHVNDAVEVGVGSEVWRLRDGIGAAQQGDASNATQIQAFLDAMGQAANADPGTGLPSSITLADFGAEMVTAQSNARARAESQYNAASSAAAVVQSARQNAEGVNIDEEMQKLMLIEQSFAANSRMLQAISEMMDTLIAAV
ncbi:flagellar hook-associated protein FlgK [Pelagimonas sp. KU-00592-HH]|jgi:flagellar hook-associated protein 1 FlgK|uniref:flagellar hook-associated protein FlgK n=1 Tax=Pelagimonas sp. KU-00592-HH TaxID=3127651 RepID=UPI00310A3F16